MKIPIKPYLLVQIKDNIVYIVTVIILVVMILFTVSYFSYQSLEKDKAINQLTKDVTGLQQKMNIFNNLLLDSEGLNNYMNLLNALLPDREDFFSILYSLEKLSQKTGFFITSYTINLQTSKVNKLQLKIEGVGDNNAFLNFLREYPFGGGRLITADKIEFDSQKTGATKIDVTFYNKDITLNKKEALNLTSQEIKEIEALNSKLNFIIKDSELNKINEVDTNYPRKTNPF